MRKLLFVLCVVVSAGCCIYSAAWVVDSRINRSADRELSERFHQAASPTQLESGARQKEPPAEEPADPFGDMKEINPDIVGWITIPGTAIDYPVVQAGDNEYYLTRDFFGEQSKRGAIFLDYRGALGGDNPIIYGHHMKDGTMFQDLEKYKSPDFRPEILLYALTGEAEIYQVVEVWQWDGTKERQEPFYEHLDSLADHYGPAPLLSLATCDYASSDARLVVVAQKRQP